LLVERVQVADRRQSADVVAEPEHLQARLDNIEGALIEPVRAVFWWGSVAGKDGVRWIHAEDLRRSADPA
jgi:hypothetical protein